MKLPYLKSLLENITEEPSSGNQDIMAVLAKSSVQNPIMVNAGEYGPVLIYKNPAGGYSVKVGNVRFPEQPTFNLQSDEEMYDWTDQMKATLVRR